MHYRVAVVGDMSNSPLCIGGYSALLWLLSCGVSFIVVGSVKFAFGEIDIARHNASRLAFCAR